MKIKKRQGFTLIELSIVLVVLSITTIGIVKLAVDAATENKVNLTQEKLEKIQYALAEFVKENQRLPCPANRNLGYASNNYGYERVNTNGAANTCSNSFASTSDTFAGVVPIHTIGLDHSYMHDAWNRKINYIVDSRFTNNVTTNTNCDADNECFANAAAGEIIIGNTVDGDEISTEIVL